jgi:hypothetical protein
LHETVARFNDGDTGLVDDLRRTGPFDEDEGRFRGIVSRALVGLNLSSERVAAAEFVLLRLQEAADCMVLTRATEIVQRRQERNKTAELLVSALKEIVAENRHERIFGRS